MHAASLSPHSQPPLLIICCRPPPPSSRSAMPTPGSEAHGTQASLMTTAATTVAAPMNPAASRPPWEARPGLASPLLDPPIPVPRHRSPSSLSVLGADQPARGTTQQCIHGRGRRMPFHGDNRRWWSFSTELEEASNGTSGCGYFKEGGHGGEGRIEEEVWNASEARVERMEMVLLLVLPLSSMFSYDVEILFALLLRTSLTLSDGHWVLS